MDVLHNLAFGFGVALTWHNLMYCAIGCTVGTLVGLLPGLGPLALPFTQIFLLIRGPIAQRQTSAKGLQF